MPGVGAFKVAHIMEEKKGNGGDGKVFYLKSLLALRWFLRVADLLKGLEEMSEDEKKGAETSKR